MREESEIRLFDKIDNMAEDLTEIKLNVASKPCSVHEEKIKNVGFQILRLWWVLGVIFAAIVGLGFKAIH